MHDVTCCGAGKDVVNTATRTSQAGPSIEGRATAAGILPHINPFAPSVSGSMSATRNELHTNAAKRAANSTDASKDASEQATDTSLHSTTKQPHSHPALDTLDEDSVSDPAPLPKPSAADADPKRIPSPLSPAAIDTSRNNSSHHSTSAGRASSKASSSTASGHASGHHGAAAVSAARGTATLFRHAETAVCRNGEALAVSAPSTSMMSAAMPPVRLQWAGLSRRGSGATQLQDSAGAFAAASNSSITDVRFSLCSGLCHALRQFQATSTRVYMV